MKSQAPHPCLFGSSPAHNHGQCEIIERQTDKLTGRKKRKDNRKNQN